MKPSLLLFATIVPGFLLTGPSVSASGDSLVTTVYSEAGNGYARKILPDGSFKREYYAIGNGGFARGEGPDRSIDDVKFPAIAGLVAEFLAQRNYYFAQNARQADLLLVISWGTTVPFNDTVNRNAQSGLLDSVNGFNAADAAAAGTPMSVEGIQSPQATLRDEARERLFGQLYQMQMFDDIRLSADARNARLLGYLPEMNKSDTPARFAGAGTSYDDLMSDIEAARYYVIIAAYDFRAATQQRKQKLLWVTRVSIQAQGNRFDRDLTGMLASASPYFGRQSNGLIRRYRDGTVNIGEMKVIGVEPERMPPAKAEEKR